MVDRYGMLAARFGNQFVVSMTDILLLLIKLVGTFFPFALLTTLVFVSIDEEQ
jgi:hypothetical protein